MSEVRLGTQGCPTAKLKFLTVTTLFLSLMLCKMEKMNTWPPASWRQCVVMNGRGQGTTIPDHCPQMCLQPLCVPVPSCSSPQSPATKSWTWRQQETPDSTGCNSPFKGSPLKWSWQTPHGDSGSSGRAEVLETSRL